MRGLLQVLCVPRAVGMSFNTSASLRSLTYRKQGWCRHHSMARDALMALPESGCARKVRSWHHVNTPPIKGACVKQQQQQVRGAPANAS